MDKVEWFWQIFNYCQDHFNCAEKNLLKYGQLVCAFFVRGYNLKLSVSTFGEALGKIMLFGKSCSTIILLIMQGVIMSIIGS